MTIFDYIELSPQTLKNYLDAKMNMTLLDVREPFEFNLCKIEGSINLPLSNLPQALQQMPKDKPIVTICHHGVRSMRAALLLKENGFDVVSLQGGTDTWAHVIDPRMVRY